jgi:hypothetical protein
MFNQDQGKTSGEKGEGRISHYVEGILRLETIRDIFVGTHRPTRILYDWAFVESWLKAYEKTGPDLPCLCSFAENMREFSTDIDGRQLDVIGKMMSPQPTFIAPAAPFEEPEGLVDKVKGIFKRRRSD